MPTWPPITMATQHPDNASAPWWKEGAFVTTHDEIEELMLLFAQLPIDEYMWDWEGKYVDEAVGEKIFSKARELFQQHPLGEDLHLTYRIPAFDGDKMHRMARSFMNILSLADFGRDLGLTRPPVTEMFLPLTTSAEQPRRVRETFKEVLRYHHAIFHTKAEQDEQMLQLLEVTPLVEEIDSLLNIEAIVQPYWESLVEERDLSEKGQRIFFARSDPALNAGLIPAVLAVKVALSEVNRIGASMGFPVHPIIGTGSLPFRGSVNPTYTSEFLEQYAGVRTYSIQSAFRYDYPQEDVEAALMIIRSEAPKRNFSAIDAADRTSIKQLCTDMSRIWQPVIEEIAPLINAIAAHVPPRRERLQHIGLFGYSRGVGKVKLPRAIGFTAALYSIGLPPELISTGRGLLAAQKAGHLDLIETYYPALRADLKHAGKFFNRENLELLAASKDVYKGIEEDVLAIETILDIRLGPEKPHHLLHRNLTSSVYHRLNAEPASEAIARDIVEAGVIRRSLG